jgi:peptide/nickel transport system ATP-binding protein
MSQPLLLARGLSRIYEARAGLWGKPRPVRAVDDLSLQVMRGETLGIVGESGSGKSTTGRMLLGLETPDSGDVQFDGAALPPRGSPAWRGQRVRMQMIYQDPMAALDRRLSLAAQIREPLVIHGIGDAAGQDRRVQELLGAVGLGRDLANRFPHEVSGGQRQRAVLARALAAGPDLLVCDEPVSALDVSVQAQVLNLLGDLQRQLGLAMVFISHDLRVVRQVSHRIAVMYLGRIVEEGRADDLFAHPGHPYTRALVSAAPTPGRTSAGRIILKGDPPNPANRPTGCAFHPRCGVAIDRCRTGAPPVLSDTGTGAGTGRRIACHLASTTLERGAA